MDTRLPDWIDPRTPIGDLSADDLRKLAASIMGQAGGSVASAKEMR